MRLPPLLPGRLVRRYKRFLADIELVGGDLIVAHCPNPGSMKTMKEEGAKVWVSHSDNPKRKLAYTWELMESCGQLTVVNTQHANRIVGEALAQARIEELGTGGDWQSEVKLGERSRIDFYRTEPSTWLEVKNVSMADGGARAAFPDAKTARGRKHLEELAAVVGSGARAVLLFCCTRAGVSTMRPASEIDGAYAEALRTARGAGVELLAYGCRVGLSEVVLDSPIELVLNS